MVAVTDNPIVADIVLSRTAYISKTDDENHLQLKTEMLPDGDEGLAEHIMKDDCAVFSRSGIKTVLAIFATKQRKSA